ncbi:MAG: hypothetical protein SPLM_02490 [Spiroplasma phoeniceum]|uniref:hypothetical protein n=1 Tax=Spiroplasma phoeniceum TaxID=47835 RepID=UPI0032885465
METDGSTISALNNYKSVAFNSYPTKIYELLDWFGIEIVDAINNGLKVKRFGVKDNSTGSNIKIRRKPRLMSNKTLKNIDNDDNKINKEIIFTEYFANNG